MAFDEIESESSAKRLRFTIPCQAEGSGEDVGTMTEQETEVEQRHDQFLRTIERLMKKCSHSFLIINYVGHNLENPQCFSFFLSP